eukprot:SAG22_NODE_1747_length_3665_cov_2.556085_1_plen_441_part_10
MKAKFSFGYGGQMTVAFVTTTNLDQDVRKTSVLGDLSWVRSVPMLQVGVATAALLLNIKAARKHYKTLSQLKLQRLAAGSIEEAAARAAASTGLDWSQWAKGWLVAWRDMNAFQSAGELGRGKKTKSLGWIALGIFQNICNIGSSLQMAAPERLVNNYSQTDWFFALAIFLTLFNSTQYLEFFPKYYVLISTVAAGLPSVLRFIAGCCPLYAGYAALGTIMFGRYCEPFGTIGQSVVTLFSVLNGDSMLDIFNCIYIDNGSFLAGAISQVYLASFICIFIYCAISVFITIMSDAFTWAHYDAASLGSGQQQQQQRPPPPHHAGHHQPGTATGGRGSGDSGGGGAVEMMPVNGSQAAAAHTGPTFSARAKITSREVFNLSLHGGSTGRRTVADGPAAAAGSLAEDDTAPALNTTVESCGSTAGDRLDGSPPAAAAAAAAAAA